MKKMITVMLLGCVISGCGDNVKSVDFYKSNVQERKDMIAQCRNGDNSKNCKNAKLAQSESTSEFMKSLAK